jgi:3'-phosphoadenosine 5'-phosphosulfate sulfotransferase (PAPS reductase)/FAD synthetase
MILFIVTPPYLVTCASYNEQDKWNEKDEQELLNLLDACKKQNIKYPLVDLKMTEEDCLKYCYNKGFDWNKLYDYFNRVSCWCCPYSSLNELRNLYIYYPELWIKLKQMDKKSNNQFRLDWSLSDLELRFKYWLQIKYKVLKILDVNKLLINERVKKAIVKDSKILKEGV